MVKDYESAHGTINDPVKVAALKAIIPLELLENRFRGKEKLDFKGLKKDLNTYLADKNPGEGGGKGKRKNGELNGKEEEENEDEGKGGQKGIDDSMTEMLANLMWMAKGGKSKGKGTNEGKNRGGWNDRWRDQASKGASPKGGYADGRGGDGKDTPNEIARVIYKN